jgi:LysM repeat protein
VAAPALFGLAAAFAVAAAPVGASAAPVPAHHTAAATAARPSGRTAGSDAAQLLSAKKPAAGHSAAAPAKYTVKSGDTLSAIAQRLYHNPRYWPVLFWANHKQIRYANEISVGQVLAVPAKPANIPAPPPVLGPAAPAPAVTALPAAYGGVAPAVSAPAGAAPAAAAAVPATTVSTSGGSSFQACVIARESGGNSQVMNASGHYGLYQFSASTWAAYGGNPADFGHASVAEQNQVFNSAIAAGGQSNWAPYDGC